MDKILRAVSLMLLVVIVYFANYAFASSMTGFAPRGEGAGVISGWVVSNVSFHSGAEVSKMDSVEFDLDGRADSVRVRLQASGNLFYQCRNSHGLHWTCDLNPQVSISEADELRVIAVGN